MENARPQTTEPSAIDSAYFADNSTAAQRQRLLDALRCGPITTIEASSLSDFPLK